jgi:hypothetical protein
MIPSRRLTEEEKTKVLDIDVKITRRYTLGMDDKYVNELVASLSNVSASLRKLPKDDYQFLVNRGDIDKLLAFKTALEGRER